MRVQGYESKVKLFLVLLVLFLVAAGIVGLNVLYRSRALLIEEAEGRITFASRAVQRELLKSGLAASAHDPAAAGALRSRLVQLARAWSASSLEIVAADGQVLSGTEPWRIGIVDPIAADVAKRDPGSISSGGAVIREPATAGDDREYGRDRGEVLVFLALDGKGTGTGSAMLLRVGHEVIGVATVTRQIRLLAITQAVAGMVVLALVFPFVRWVLRPYRALSATVAQFEATEKPAVSEPEDLVSSFRGVIGKLKEQERELERMRAIAHPGQPGAVGPELINGLTSGVLIIDAGGQVTALNPAGEKILGLARDTVLARDFREVFGASPALLAVLRDGVEAGRAHSREVIPYSPTLRRAGLTAHLGVTVSAIPLPGTAGTTGMAGTAGGGAFCLFSDLTEIRGLAERVRLKENLAGLGEMSAGIAHEFRNSLATILGYARLIGKDMQADTAVGDHTAAIVREVQSIGRIVDDFLRYARPAALATSDWSPRDVIGEVAAGVPRDLGRPEVVVTIGGDWPPLLHADEGLLRQTFANLLRNAVESIPLEAGDRGRVSVTAALDPEAGLVRIEVADTGPGIPPELLGRLFMPFVTTKEKGTGLGLALAQKAIVCHDGSITAGNTEQGGARIVITLPVGVGRSALVMPQKLTESQRLI